MLKVIEAGLQSSVQDLGRHGQRHQGIAQCGALDSVALRTANLLVGNPADCATIEIQGGRVVLQLERDGNIALCGQGFFLAIGSAAPSDPHQMTSHRPLVVKQGETLHITPRRGGSGSSGGGRSYLAVDGGLDVAQVMGSRATDLHGGFGGGAGRALRDGDLLPLGPASGYTAPDTIATRPLLPGWHIRALVGPEQPQLGSERAETFWSSDWQIGNDSNRMGCRLRGEASETLRDAARAEINSHGVVPGTVQLPRNGQPIVLLADGQTTGGYPRIATVIAADLWRLAQMPQGQPFRFVRCSAEQAVAALRQQQQQLYRLQLASQAIYKQQPTTRRQQGEQR